MAAAKQTTSKHQSHAADTRTIKAVKPNPHKEGSNRYKAFEAAVAAKTVADYLATGHKAKYIERWRKSGHIEVAGQQAAPAATPAPAHETAPATPPAKKSAKPAKAPAKKQAAKPAAKKAAR